MSKFLYPIYKLKTKSYIKWWLYHKKAGGSGVLSEILQGFSFNLENTLNRKFKLFDVEGNSVQDGSPSPDNEVPILSAGDNENLLDIQTIVKGRLDNGEIGYADNVENLTLNKDSFSFTTNANYRGVTSDFIKISKDFIVSYDNLNTEFVATAACYDKNKVWLGNATITGADDQKYRQYAIVNNTAYVRVYFYLVTAGTITVKNPKLEKGNKASGYSPYGMGSINEKIKNADGTEEQDYSIFVQQPFRSIGNVRDCFVKKDGNWFERHYIGEVVLNGTEYWELSTSTSDYYEFITYNSLKPVAPSSYTFPMASHFGNATNNRCVANGNQLLIRVPASMNITNATEFKNWLQENNVTINYLLAEPLDLPCTPEQIVQLENLPSTYKDFTIINSEDETPAHLRIQYYKEG